MTANSPPRLARMAMLNMQNRLRLSTTLRQMPPISQVRRLIHCSFDHWHALEDRRRRRGRRIQHGPAQGGDGLAQASLDVAVRRLQLPEALR